MTPLLWGRVSSVNVQKVLWCLAELGISYDRIDAGWTYGKTDTDDFAAMNPNRLVPVWQEKDLTLWESHAIVRHLTAQNPGVIAHGPVSDQWMDFVASTFMPAITAIFYQCVRLPVEQRSSEELERQSETLNRVLSIVDGQLKGADWIDGRAFSTGDIAVGAMLFRVFDLSWPRHRFDHLERYFAALCERPAYRDWVIASYEELRA